MQNRSIEIGKRVFMGLAVAVFATMIGLADQNEVKAATIDINGDRAIGSETITSADDVINVTADATLTIKENVTVKQIAIADDKTLIITGPGKITVSAGDSRPIVSLSDPSYPSRGNLTVDRGKIRFESNGPGTELKNILIKEGSTVESNCQLVGDKSVSITGGTVNIDSSLQTYYNSSTFTISGGKVTCKKIFASQGITISGESTEVTVRSTEGPAIIAHRGNISIEDPLRILTPADGIIKDFQNFGNIDKTVYESDGTTIAQTVIIKAPASKPEEKTDDSVKEEDKKDNSDNKNIKSDDKKSKKSSSDDKSGDSPLPAAKTNPLSLILSKITGLPYGTFAARTTHGPAAQAAFAANMPAGYKKGLSFNLITNNTTETTLKSGSFTLQIPKELQKPGRTFQIQAIDKNGKVIVLPDLDKDPATITVAFGLEGYAFDLIYKD